MRAISLASKLCNGSSLAYHYFSMISHKICDDFNHQLRTSTAWHQQQDEWEQGVMLFETLGSHEYFQNLF